MELLAIIFGGMGLCFGIFLMSAVALSSHISRQEELAYEYRASEARLEVKRSV